MRRKIIRNILTPKSTKLHVSVENKNQNMKNECTDLSKNHQNGRHFGILAAVLKFCRYFGGIFLLENVASSHNLILKCKIPLNSIKQGKFILPAKFKPYFYTHACKWIGFSQSLPHISLSLIIMARNPI